MYIRNDYSPDTYRLLNKLNDEIEELNPERGETDSYERREFLIKKLNVRYVRTGVKSKVSIRSKEWLPCDIDRAMNEIIRRKRKYLEKYKVEFERDKQEGKLSWIAGEQMEMEFEDFIPTITSVGTKFDKMSRDEIRYYFLNSIGKS